MISSMPHDYGNTPNPRVAAPKSINPTSVHKNPSPSIRSANVYPRILPLARKVSMIPTSKSAHPVDAAKKPIVPSNP